jgi:hypothetical protein
MNSGDNAMSVHDEERRERQRRQTAHRRALSASAKAARAVIIATPGPQNMRDEFEIGKSTAEFDGPLEAAANQEAEIQTTETDPREAQWAGYCQFALNLHRRGELTSFHDNLRNGHCRDVEAPQLMNAAIEFVTQRGELRPLRWSPAPTDEQLEDLPAWITLRLAEERAVQEETERRKRWHKGLARELAKAAGQPQLPSGNGQRAVYQQRSKHDLEELARRLEWTMAQHQAERGTFQRTWLDPRSLYYIRDRDGGIGTKGIIFMANAIVGRQERRDYEENWTIVMNWLREQQASRCKPESHEP